MKKGLAFLIAAACAWGSTSVLIKILSVDFDAITQAFFRYISAGTTVFIICFIFERDKLVAGIKKIKMLFIPVMVVFISQISYVNGVYRTSAIAASLIVKLNAVTISILSFIVLVEERRVIKNPFFLLGTLFAFLGVGGVILGKADSAGDSTNLGAALLIFSMFHWSVYTVMIKRVVDEIDPLVIAGLVPLMACVLFLPTVAIFGDFHRIVEVSTKSRLLLFGSGMLVIGMGNVSYYSALKHVGAPIASSFLLITPLITGILSFFILDERLTHLQLAFSILLLFGCFLITRVKRN